MSRRKSQSHSLDLLLDTICNTFGGVLFIAILVVILLQLSGDHDPPDVQQSISPDAYRQMQNRFATVTAQLAELRRTTASQDELIAEFAPDEVRELIDQRRKLTAERDRLQSELDTLTVDNLKLAEQAARTRASNAVLRKSLADIRIRQRTLETELQELRDSRVRKTALPVAKRAAGKNEVGVIVRYGRMYIWHRYGRFGDRKGLNTNDFVIVAEEDGALVTHPKPTAGIPLNDSDDMRHAIRARLSAFSPGDYYISAVVRPDSFGHFQYLRDALIANGFEYQLMPAAEGTTIIDRGGSGGKVQ